VIISYSAAGKDWASMGEIIPSLEKLWASLANEEHEVSLIRLGEHEIQLKELLATDQVVFLAPFPYKAMSSVMKLIRVELKLPCRFILYLHDAATVGAWPFEALGISKLFQKQDLFVATCSGDVALMKSCFEGAQVAEVPFCLAETPLRAPLEGSPQYLFYSGRLSEQKQIHFLLYLYSLYQKEGDLELHLFGKEDGLGSPNMGMPSKHYEKFLRGLRARLQLEKRVHFHGHLKRSDLEQRLSLEQGIYLGLGLHSDENFGMAAYRALLQGHRALLSAWGGHLTLAALFPEQVELTPVFEGEYGPYLDVQTCLTKLHKMSFKNDPFTLPTQAELFHRSQKKLKELCHFRADQTPLIPTRLFKQVVQAQKYFAHDLKEKNLVDQEYFCYRLFKDYKDPLSRPFQRAYGMKEDTPLVQGKTFLTPPWVKKEEHKIVVHDPYRGTFEKTRLAKGPYSEAEKTWLKNCGEGFTLK
jgi:hypothetical protein